MELSKAQITQCLTILKLQSDVIVCKSCKHYKTEQCYGCIENYIYNHWEFREPCPTDCAGITKTQVKAFLKVLYDMCYDTEMVVNDICGGGCLRTGEKGEDIDCSKCSQFAENHAEDEEGKFCDGDECREKCEQLCDFDRCSIQELIQAAKFLEKGVK